jgi:hypothetical protein
MSLVLLPWLAQAQPTGYPDASTTGVPAGTTLTVSTGNMSINTPGTIIDSMDIRGCIDVNAANVIIRKSKVSCDGGPISSFSTNLLVEDATLDCQGNSASAIGASNYTARRVDASNCENVLWVDGNVTIEDSYLHDPIPYNIVTDPHTDTVQLPSGASNVTIRHNRIYGNYLSASDFGNSAITTGGGVSNLLIENNLLAGGGYTLRCEGGGGNTTYRVRNNRFSTVFTANVGGFGAVNECETNATVYTGNVMHETGVLLPGQPALSAAPTLSITSPTSSPTLSTGATPLTTLAGTASDDVAVSSVTWACPTCTPTSGTASGTTSWSVASIGLTAGANVLTVTATDGDNQTGQDTLTVTYTSGVAVPTVLRLVR